MELLEWNENFTTGIHGIDHEHQELISSINAFYVRQSQHGSKDELVDILNDIYGAIHAHFMLEENLMKKHGYAEYQQHKEDHDRLLDEIREITMALEETTSFDEQQFKQKLSEWFSLHFKTFDSRLHQLEQLMANTSQPSSLLDRLLNSIKTLLLLKK